MHATLDLFYGYYIYRVFLYVSKRVLSMEEINRQK